MTIDPDGAMHDWVDLPAGWRLLRVPTQEAVHVLGVRGYQALLVDLCEEESPDLLVTHPPYDYLTPSVAERLRAAGTRVVGYAFDDEIFGAQYDDATRAAIGRIYDRYVTTRQVRWATAPLAAITPAKDPDIDVVLVGRAYARRRTLVAALRSAGLRVLVRGHGWSAPDGDGLVSRAEMLRLYARAKVVLTTADWESRAVPMVKHRLLDTAMLGAFQIAQAAPDLRDYFSADEVPSFADADELIAQVHAALDDPAARLARARTTRQRALDEHTWEHRFAELIEGVPVEPRATGEKRSLAFDQLLLALATRAESDGRSRAAAALYRESLARHPDEPTAAGGLGRCLRDAGDLEAALPWLLRAAAAEPPTLAGALYAAVPSFGVGAGLGRLALWPPAAEPLALIVASLVELERNDEAIALIDTLHSPALVRAVAATLTVGDAPELAGLRAALLRLAARGG